MSLGSDRRPQAGLRAPEHAPTFLPQVPGWTESGARRSSPCPSNESPAPRLSLYACRLADPRRPTSRHGLSPDSPLLGHGPAPEGYDHQTGVLDLPAPAPAPPPEDEGVDLRELRGL